MDRMKDAERTKEELLHEIQALRNKVKCFEEAGERRRDVVAALTERKVMI